MGYDLKNSPCLACGRVEELQKHAQRKFYENMVKASFQNANLVVDTPISFLYFPHRKDLKSIV